MAKRVYEQLAEEADVIARFLRDVKPSVQELDAYRIRWDLREFARKLRGIAESRSSS